MFDIANYSLISARALFKHMEWRYHGVPWPSVSLSPVDLVSHFVKRINEASVYLLLKHDNFTSYLKGMC